MLPASKRIGATQLHATVTEKLIRLLTLSKKSTARQKRAVLYFCDSSIRWFPKRHIWPQVIALQRKQSSKFSQET
jgi:enterochelin esterase-like enzyme